MTREGQKKEDVNVRKKIIERFERRGTQLYLFNRIKDSKLRMAFCVCGKCK